MKNLSLLLFISGAMVLCSSKKSYASIVNASTFGWNATNATTAFVNAINSANDTIVIDKQASDWMINPTHFEYVNNKTIIFENGVNLVARPGAFSGIYSTLFYLDECNNITVIGYGATFKMQKNEYIAYNNSQYRHCISMMSCNNIKIYGLKLMDSGGDGILVASWTGITLQRYCENILLKDLWADNHYRQGISVISAQHLRIENCWFTNTAGTAPQAGVDIEPNQPYERLIDIVFEKCRFTGNAGNGIKIIPFNLDGTSLPVEITFNYCYVSNNGTGYQIALRSDNSGTTGNVYFNNCMTDGGAYSVGGSKSVLGWKAHFNNCVFRNPTNIVVNFDDYTTSASLYKNGGASFTNCLAFYNTTYRYFNVWHANTTTAGLDDVQFNNFTVINPNTVAYNNGGNVTANCVFNFQTFTTTPPTNANYTAGSNLIECNTTNSLLNFSRDALSNTTFPIATTYDITGTGIQALDYSRMKGFEIIPVGSLSQSDNFLVLKDVIVEPTKTTTVMADATTLFTTTSLPQDITIVDCAVVLPIKLLSFSGKCYNKNILLKWSTTSEINNAFFALEKSIDGIIWTPIAKIKGKVNSTTINDYSFTDTEQFNRQVYYRLKQVDIDGMFKYSTIMSVDICSTNMNLFTISPNPSNGNITVKLNGLTGVQQLQIYNAVGQFVKEVQVIQNKNISIFDLPNGLYFIKLKNNSQSIKLVKQN
jgi:Secretion system C-terminal sorting domain